MTRPSELCRNKEWLYHQYITLRKNAPEVARLAGVTQCTVLRWLERHGIPVRDIYQCQVADNSQAALLKDSDWLRQQYDVEGKTAKEIAKEIGVGQTTVVEWMKRHGIERRTYTEARTLQNPKLSFLNDEEWLRHQYVTLRRSANSIAKELDTSDFIVKSRLEAYGMQVRNISESKIAEDVLAKLNDKDCISGLYRNGLTTVEIAEKIGCSMQSVYRRLEEMGYFAIRKRNVRAWENECYRVFSEVIGRLWIGQETFPWLRIPSSRMPLRVDMYIPSMELCIEFDGAGHFRPIQYGKSRDKDADFAKTKERDTYKNELIPKHGMKLIRFPFYVPLTKESVRTWLIENGVNLDNAS